jgi:hypothetical protein
MDDRDREILVFEAKWWRYAGNKADAIMRTFDISPIRYAQILNRVLDDPEAQAQDPLLVGRLRRLRDQRVTGRDQRKELP